MEEEHMEDEEHIEPNGFECVECNENFESVDKVIEHENEGECDLCGKWLGCGTNMENHKKKEHETTSEEGNKEEENTDKDGKLVHEEEYDEIINSNIVAENREPTIEILITENSLTDNIEIEGANPEMDKQTVGEQDKVDKITEGSLLDNRNVNLQFERTRLEEIKNFIML